MDLQDLQNQFQGITAIACTPMTDDYEVDPAATQRHLRFLVNHGITTQNGLVVVTGSTGESGAMSADERKRIWDAAADEVGDELPIIAGINHSNLRETIAMAESAEKAGAAGVMAVSPYYYTPTPDAVRDFYTALSESTPLGIMIYNNTEVTHYDIPVDVLDSIASLTNLVAIKECSPNFAKLEQSARILSHKLTVINGHGEFLEPMAAIAGTSGFISSVSNFAPYKASQIWESRSRGDYASAKELRDELSPYLDLAASFGAAAGEPKVLSLLKYLATKVGSPMGQARLPLPSLSETDKRLADNALSAVQKKTTT